LITHKILFFFCFFCMFSTRSCRNALPCVPFSLSLVTTQELLHRVSWQYFSLLLKSVSTFHFYLKLDNKRHFILMARTHFCTLVTFGNPLSATLPTTMWGNSPLWYNQLARQTTHTKIIDPRKLWCHWSFTKVRVTSHVLLIRERSQSEELEPITEPTHENSYTVEIEKLLGWKLCALKDHPLNPIIF
jgi:hypothetical protein